MLSAMLLKEIVLCRDVTILDVSFTLLGNNKKSGHNSRTSSSYLFYSIRRIPVPILRIGSDKLEDAVPVFYASLFQEPVY